MTPTYSLPPNGDHGTQELPVEVNGGQIRSLGYAEGAAADFDWYNDKLQILVFDHHDDPLLHVRLNPDGTVAEILVRDRETLRKMLLESEARVISDWEKERDGE